MSDFDDFVNLIHTTQDKELLKDFLVGVTTAKERKELTQRVEIIKRLVRGDPQAMIANDLGVGVATITRGSKELANGYFKILKEK